MIEVFSDTAMSTIITPLNPKGCNFLNKYKEREESPTADVSPCMRIFDETEDVTIDRC